jgi:hypothetical protein
MSALLIRSMTRQEPDLARLAARGLNPSLHDAYTFHATDLRCLSVSISRPQTLILRSSTEKRTRTADPVPVHVVFGYTQIG